VRKIFFMLLFFSMGGAVMWGGIQILSSSSLPFLKPSRKQPPVPLSIGVIDINSIESQSQVFQKFKKFLDDLNTKIYKETVEQETALRKEYEQLRQREEEATEPTEDILKQKREFDKKNADLEKAVLTRREELDAQYTKGLSDIKQTLKEIVDDMGKTYGLTVILNKSTGDGNQMSQSIVLFCNEGLNLTQEVIQRLDAALLSKNIGKNP
jgi:Skp family chaperone for outer membrane proteins